MKYKVPFVNYPLQYHLIKTEVDEAFFGCLNRGDLIYRDDLINFEKKFAGYQGSKYGIGTGSCTGAMYISLKAAGIKHGDEVITVAHTYVASIDVIVHCGAIPILVDVRNDFNMNMDNLESAVTPKTKAIIPVHLNGRMCDMKRLEEIAEDNNLKIIEDAAQACGAKFKGQGAGSFGFTGCFSFYPSKVLGWYGEGGMVITKDEELARKLALLRDHGELPGYLKQPNEKDEKIIHFYGYNTILDNIAAAILNVKLKYLPKWIERRRKIATRYKEGLSDISEIILPPAPSNGDFFDVYQNYVIRIKNRDELVNHLENNGVETIISWRIPNHKQKALNLGHFHLPMTEQISNEVISIPMYPELTNEQVNYVITSIHDFMC